MWNWLLRWAGRGKRIESHTVLVIDGHLARYMRRVPDGYRPRLVIVAEKVRE
jgi:hypothetical protein